MIKKMWLAIPMAADAQYVIAHDEQTFNDACHAYGNNAQNVYIVQRPMEVYALCEGRHKMPFSMDALYPHEVDPFAFIQNKVTAEMTLSKLKELDPWVVIYVTGLSSALISAVQGGIAVGRSIFLMHFDRDTGFYRPQYVGRGEGK